MPEERQDQIRLVRVENLYLDPENPRLSRGGARTNQEELLKNIYKRYAIDDLVSSLSQHGYFSEEPLIAVESEDSSEAHRKYVIVEGNRRLAALKLLLFEADRRAANARGIPVIGTEIRQKLERVPIKVYPTRREIVPYMGVRHITGVKPWNSAAKARYIEKLARDGYTIADITKMVASRGDVVGRLLLTRYVIDQVNNIQIALSQQRWQDEAEGFSFSFLYTALGYNTVLSYIGLTRASLKDPQENPVPESHHQQLALLMTDLYGSPDGSSPTRLEESRDIHHLARVYGSNDALKHFRSGGSIDEAWKKAGGEKVELVGVLQEVHEFLIKANSLAPNHRGDKGLIRLSELCINALMRLHDILEAKDSAVDAK